MDQLVIETDIQRTPSFINSSENIFFDLDYSYLLNFWYTSKVNKENNYIKRNGLHPHFLFNEDGNLNSNSFVTCNAEGNNVNLKTVFYTVFKIFLENVFKDFKISKTRDVEEWKLLFPADKNGLDSEQYLKFSYCEHHELNLYPLMLQSIRPRYGVTHLPSFKVLLNKKDILQSKEIFNCFNQIDEEVSSTIDEGLKSVLSSLFDHMIYRNIIKVPQTIIVQAEINNPIAETNDAEDTEEYLQIVEERVHSLLPVWSAIQANVPAIIAGRARFSFLLAYAKAQQPSLFDNIQDSNENYDGISRLINNFAA